MNSPLVSSIAARAGVLAVLGLAATTLASAAPAPLHPLAARSMMHGFAAVPLAADALRENDRVFLDRAVESSRQQMRLAQVGASHADSSEVRTHALTLAADYRELGEGLDALIRRRGGVAGAPVGGSSENYQKLQSKAGSEFDRAFIRAAAELGNKTMTLFETAAAESRDPDVREFAAAQLPILRAHHNTITELKKALD